MKNDETVPVSELMQQHGNPFVTAEQVKPREPARPLPVSLSIFAAAWVGACAQQLADFAPGSRLIAILGALTILMLIGRWTERP